MKNVLSLVLLLGVATFANAQTPMASSATTTTSVTAAIPEPGTPGQVALLEDGHLVPLEARPLKYVPKMKGLGTTVVQMYDGAPAQVPLGAKLVVRLGDKPPYNTPSAVVLGLFPLLKGGVPEEKGIEIGFAPYGVNSAEILIPGGLVPGKYVVKTGAGFLVEVAPAKVAPAK